MMEAARTSETSVDIQLRTRQYIPEDSELQEGILTTQPRRSILRISVRTLLMIREQTPRVSCGTLHVCWLHRAEEVKISLQIIFSYRKCCFSVSYSPQQIWCIFKRLRNAGILAKITQ
jgi:hypothetical protein